MNVVVVAFVVFDLRFNLAGDNQKIFIFTMLYFQIVGPNFHHLMSHNADNVCAVP